MEEGVRGRVAMVPIGGAGGFTGVGRVTEDEDEATSEGDDLPGGLCVAFGGAGLDVEGCRASVAIAVGVEAVEDDEGGPERGVGVGGARRAAGLAGAR